jgi:hypothetical protein
LCLQYLVGLRDIGSYVCQWVRAATRRIT